MSLAPESDTSALDAYSRIVTAVAAELTPHVAALQVTGPDGRGGAGSAVVVPGDGLLVTLRRRSWRTPPHDPPARACPQRAFERPRRRR